MTTAPVACFDQVTTLVEPRIKKLLDRLDPHNRLVAAYHLGYCDADGAPATAVGKGLRPALALLSARAAGEPPGPGVPAAVAVELAHNFSLLHDDVMDHDGVRRHRPTAWAVFGPAAAILAGDALLSLAHESLAEADQPGAVRAVARLGADVRRLVAGQAADLDFERRDDVGLDECLAMSADKTGALLSCACALGALLCGAPPALTAGLSRFGSHLGVAFQLVDDLLGIWGDPGRTGKPILSDLRARKKSVPIVHALTSGTAAGDAFRMLYAPIRQLRESDLELAARLLDEAGSRDWTGKEADRQLGRALDELSGLDLPAAVRSELVDLSYFVTGRDH
ncbi:polyprenyl synthetase family protein [Planosporangium thailandense]|uniref:Polyprenyl synthetase family protein n=1 Tax=Planosporangium thailandense TaxID=765197 RepID=A0ABX0XYT4_9ACTN|nr:polyprenyl synthetase family protein [Planosporangium thailandense]NJC71203.1 polyprenyl synthetase family protein [Planosporangium thailandense]